MSAAAIENIIPTSLYLLFSALTDPGDKALIARWRREHEAETAKKLRRSTVLHAIGEGYDLLTEISAHTGIPDATARRYILEFIKQKKVRCLKVKNHNCRFELRYQIV